MPENTPPAPEQDPTSPTPEHLVAQLLNEFVPAHPDTPKHTVLYVDGDRRHVLKITEEDRDSGCFQVQHTNPHASYEDKIQFFWVEKREGKTTQCGYIPTLEGGLQPTYVNVQGSAEALLGLLETASTKKPLWKPQFVRHLGGNALPKDAK